MEESATSFSFDKTSNIWLQPFSVLINCMFPVEYVYGDWIWWQAEADAKYSSDPELLSSWSPRDIQSGSRVEGFCIPQFLVAKCDIAEPLDIPYAEREQWQPDLDVMKLKDSFHVSNEKKEIPIFTVEDLADDPRYVKLRFTKEWKEYRPSYKNAIFVNQSYTIPSLTNNIYKQMNEDAGASARQTWTYDVHGPVRKIQSLGQFNYEGDQTRIFKYPLSWPKSAMDWLVRPRQSGWPSPELIQDIFESGCHLAPVGRGKRLGKPISFMQYIEHPEQASGSETSQEKDDGAMDETEWRLSFSVAENKLGRSVTPVQRHVVVLLKIIKKAYFPDVISSYLLKNLLFWEIEKQDESFWTEENSGMCVLLMLDRLQKCLENQLLPHYIVPESNLLQYEDPGKLAEGAAIISEVRKNILPKTASILKRVLSLTYHSHLFIEDLKLEPLLVKIQDSSLSEEKLRGLICSILDVFSGKSKYVIESCVLVKRLQKKKNEEYIQKTFCIPMYAYQSLLARILCRMWSYTCDKYSDTKTEEDGFISFVKDKVGEYLSVDEDFIALARSFFGHMKESKDLSQLIPYTTVMKRTGEIYKEIAWNQVEKINAEMKEKIGWLRTSDLNFDSLSTMEDITREFGRNINLRYQELLQEFSEADKSNDTPE